VFSTWREHYRAGQEAKPQIERERWEQERRWPEEERAARWKALQENAVDLDEHNATMKTARVRRPSPMMFT
jgi:hypothetical protein